MKELSTSLYFKDEKSDKIYQASLEKSGQLFVVNFAYGKRDGTLKVGTKTPAPVAYEKAKKIYDKLVKSKTDKGYKPSDGAPSAKATTATKSVKKKAAVKSTAAKKAKATKPTTKNSTSTTNRPVADLSDQLTQLLADEKDLLPFLKSLSEKEKKSLTPEVRNIFKKVPDNTLKGKKAYLMEQLGFFFLTYKETQKIGWALHNINYRITQSIMDTLPFYRPEWFDEKMSRTEAKYLTWARLASEGHLNAADHEASIAQAFGNCVFSSDENYKDVATEDHLYIYPETLNSHIYMAFRNAHSLYYRDADGTTWKTIILKLLAEKKIDRKKVLDNLYRANILRDRKEFGIYSSKITLTDSRKFIDWNFSLLEDLEPTEKEIINLQEKMVNCFNSPYSEAITTNVKLLERVVAHKDFAANECFQGLAKILTGTNIKETTVILNFMKTVLEKKPELENKVFTTVNEGLKNVAGVQKRIKAFLKKHSEMSEKEMKAYLASEKKKEMEAAQPKEEDFAGIDPETIQKVSDLLLSVEDASTKVAFAILENQTFPKVLLTEVFAIYKLTEDEALKQTALEIITAHGSKAVQEKLKSKLSLGFGNRLNPPTEKTIKKNILTYVKDNELNGLKLAKALYQKYGLGVAYLLDESPEDQQVAMFKTFLNGTALVLNDKALTKFPPAIFQFPELTTIDLSNNKIGKIPAEIKIFKNLKVLNLTGNNLKSIHKDIKELTALEELYLNKNYMKKVVPKELFELSALRKLDLTSIKDQHEIYELPENIVNLKKMEWFKLDDLSGRSHHDSYSNYPQIREVTGNPLNMNPLPIAEAAFDQGDLSPTAYIFKHGDTRLIRKVLDHYYDQATKTFDFKKQFVDVLPDEILKYDVVHLNLHGSRMGSDRWANEQEHRVSDAEKTKILAKMTGLETLNISNCGFVGLADLGSLKQLVKLDISGNGIEEISDLSHLVKLEELHLKGNQFKLPPVSIFKISNLKILDMYSAFSYNFEPTAAQFKGLSSMKKLKMFKLYSFELGENKAMVKEIKSYLPEGCEFEFPKY